MIAGERRFRQPVGIRDNYPTVGHLQRPESGGDIC